MTELILVDSSPSTAHCLICGEGLASIWVSCPSCSSPYHAECFSYNDNKCAIFGCRPGASSGPSLLTSSGADVRSAASWASTAVFSIEDILENRDGDFDFIGLEVPEGRWDKITLSRNLQVLPLVDEPARWSDRLKETLGLSAPRFRPPPARVAYWMMRAVYYSLFSSSWDVEKNTLARKVRDSWRVYAGLASSEGGYNAWRIGTGTSVCYGVGNQLQMTNHGWSSDHPFSAWETIPEFHGACAQFPGPANRVGRSLRSFNTVEDSRDDEVFVSHVIGDGGREALDQAFRFFFIYDHPQRMERLSLRYIEMKDHDQFRFISFGTEDNQGLIELHREWYSVPGGFRQRGVECHGILADPRGFHPRSPPQRTPDSPSNGSSPEQTRLPLSARYGTGIYDLRDMD